MKNYHKSFLLRIISGVALMLATASQPLLSAIPSIYDVEIVVFLNKSAHDDGEQWPRPDLGSQNNGSFPDGEFTELGKSHYTLKGVSRDLERSNNYSVLFHRAWRQLAYDRDTAVAYPVHSIIQSDGNSVEGTVKLMLERFLHLDINLFLMSSDGDKEMVYSDSPGNVPLFELREKRRIKSTELHYFDHPRFGAIAKITPYIPQNAGHKTIEINNGNGGSSNIKEEPVTNPAANDDQLRR